MSKRFIFPQQNGERKKARLDVSISDHNFPLSQNSGCSKGKWVIVYIIMRFSEQMRIYLMLP